MTPAEQIRAAAMYLYEVVPSAEGRRAAIRICRTLDALEAEHADRSQVHPGQDVFHPEGHSVHADRVWLTRDEAKDFHRVVFMAAKSRASLRELANHELSLRMLALLDERIGDK